ncbi:MAG: type 4a pilus biogenesis protein PilO, partial [Candidatus Omnitrophota bacterium]
MIQKFYNKLSEQEKKIFYIAVGVGVLALFDLLFLRPVTSRLSVIDQEISEKEIGMKRDLRFLGYQDRILNEMKAYESYYAKEAQSPDQIRAEFLQQIEKLATGSKVNLTKISPSGEQERKGFIEYYADLECDGLFDNVVSFMHQVDSTKDLLKIVKMNLTGRAAGSRDVSAVMKVVKVILDPKAVWVQAELVEQLKSAKPSEPKGAGSADPARDLDKKSAGSGARAGASGSVPEEKGSAEGAAGKGASAQAGGASAGGAAGGKEGAGSGGGGSGGDGGQRALKGKGEGVGVAGGGGSGGGGGAAGAGASGSGGGGSGGGGGAAGSGASGSG